jgi:YVTN family beta-propeller protein
MAISPDGAKLYAIDNQNDGVVAAVDTASFEISSSIAVGLDPIGIVMSSDGTQLFVSNRGSHTVSRIDVLSDQSDGTVVFFISPCQALLSVVDPESAQVELVQLDAAASALAISPSSRSLYIGHAHAVSVFNTESSAVTRMAARGTGPSMLLIAANNDRLYAACPNANDILALDLSTRSIAGTFGQLFYPGGMALTADGLKLIAAETGFSGRPGTTVSIFDTTTFTSTAKLPAQEGPIRLSVDASGSRAYVTNFGDLIPVSTSLTADKRAGFGSTVSMFDLSNQSKIQEIEVDSFSSGPLALATVGNFSIVSNFLSGTIVAIDLTAPGNFPIVLGNVPGPTKVALHPDLTQAYILSDGDPLTIESTDNGRVAVLTGLQNLPILPVTDPAGLVVVGRNPSDIALPPLNAAVQKVVVTNFGSHTISVIDPADLGAGAFDLAVGAGPVSVVMTSDGAGAYVANFYDDTVMLVYLSQAVPSVIATVATGAGPVDLAIDGSTETVYVANMIANTLSVINGQSVVETIELPD